MTVRELMKLLKTMPKDAPVLYINDGGEVDDITTVEYQEHYKQVWVL